MKINYKSPASWYRWALVRIPGGSTDAVIDGASKPLPATVPVCDYELDEARSVFYAHAVMAVARPFAEKIFKLTQDLDAAVSHSSHMSLYGSNFESRIADRDAMRAFERKERVEEKAVRHLEAYGMYAGVGRDLLRRLVDLERRRSMH
jgi:hypothetical protein